MVQHDLPSAGRDRTGPVRTCVGCRQRTLAAELLRIVAREQGPDGFALVPDPGHRLSGRGAWLHPNPDCLGQAARRRAFGRALRVSGTLDTAALDQLVGSATERPRDVTVTGEHASPDGASQ
ncbi:YlxR family protein [Rhodococcus chondri]|uniref:YlxR family protein n=1 Tax=Rhodococcus chondri TaxID=3065941 RepID=A0ABU7JYH4_9NOCA|nr:YlxR family protein [Rhodococcus sp. CC-R104]MEE2035059.1 YlxR family protein [Rhodococcus sp. CC-R104]